MTSTFSSVTIPFDDLLDALVGVNDLDQHRKVLGQYLSLLNPSVSGAPLKHYSDFSSCFVGLV